MQKAAKSAERASESPPLRTEQPQRGLLKGQSFQTPPVQYIGTPRVKKRGNKGGNLQHRVEKQSTQSILPHMCLFSCVEPFKMLTWKLISSFAQFERTV